jgi:hypothetical protein
VSNYLKIVEKAKKTTGAPAPSNKQTSPATKETKATKVPTVHTQREKPPRDKSDISDKRPPNFTPLTVSEILAEINRWGSGAGKNTELYRRGELSEEKAVEYVTCAILAHRGVSFKVWRHHAPAARKALALCIHELEPGACKVCSGSVRRLIQDQKKGAV